MSLLRRLARGHTDTQLTGAHLAVLHDVPKGRVWLDTVTMIAWRAVGGEAREVSAEAAALSAARPPLIVPAYVDTPDPNDQPRQVPYLLTDAGADYLAARQDAQRAKKKGGRRG